MAINDVIAYNEPPFGSIGTRKYAVGASATIIYPGEIVVRALGGYVVTQMATNKPVVGSDYVVGIAASVSTNTAAAAGYVEVTPMVPGQVWLANPAVAATWNTQSEYDALVGDRVIFNLTSGVFTILAADGATYGCVIMPLDVDEYPGKVAFSFRNDVSHLHA
jgi:hypothetical protein